MFRNFDNHDTYTDLKGKPLHGCVMFNVFNGNTVADIYTRDKARLNNPILTDLYGRTSHQVFIDTDVTAYFYKYTGNGRFSDNIEEAIDINDDTKWSLQYTVDNIDEYDNNIISNSSTVITDIDALRNIDAADIPSSEDGIKSIILLGYNEAGDKEAITYIWNAESYDNDNGGSIIQGHNLTGRWIMNRPTEHCDSRHFGIFPQDNLDVDISTRLEKFITYCNDESLRPFFNGSDDYPYFTFSNIRIESINPIDISEGTIFNDNGSNEIKSEYNGIPHFKNANTTLDVSNIDIESNASSAINFNEITIRTGGYNQWTTSYKDITVNIVDGVWNNLELDNVILKGEHVLGNYITLKNMKLYPEMFNDIVNSYTLNTYVNCVLDINDWKEYTDIWAYIRNEMGLVNNDHQGYEGPVAAYSAGKVYNFNGTATTNLVINDGNFELNNVTGSFDIEIKDTIRLNNFNGTLSLWGEPFKVEIINSNVTIPSGGDATTYEIHDSYVHFDNDIECDNMTVHSSEINGNVYIESSNIEIFNSYIDTTLSGNQIECKNSSIHDVISTGNEGVISDIFEGCTFNGQNIIKGIPGVFLTVNTIWRNNIGKVEDPITIDEDTDIKVNEFEHGYKYSGNTGTFKLAKWNKEMMATEIIQKKEWYNDSTKTYPNPILNFTKDDETFNVYFTTTEDISTDWKNGDSNSNFEGFYVNIPSGYNIDVELFNLTGDSTARVHETYKFIFSSRYYLNDKYNEDNIHVQYWPTTWNDYYSPMLDRHNYQHEPYYEQGAIDPNVNEYLISNDSATLKTNAPISAYFREISLTEPQIVLKNRRCWLNNRYIPLKIYAKYADEDHPAITSCILYVEYDIKRD